MKYCLSSRQSHEYLKRADEIKVKYRDRDIIYDYSQKYPTATIILEMPLNGEEVNWAELNNYQRVTEGRFIVCIANLKDAEKCKAANIKFYYGFPIGSFYELRSLKEIGVCYFRLSAPVFFQLDKVKQLGVPVRAVPNVAYDGYFPQPNGLYGTWIRPEDIPTYDEYVETFEFEAADLEKERALYRIYHDDGKWPGDLNLLFTNFNIHALNRHLPNIDALAKRRTTCGHRCQDTFPCSICKLYMSYGDPADYQEEITEFGI